MILLAIALQATAAQPTAAQSGKAAAVPERFSILAKQCGQPDDKGTIVVCGNGDTGNRIPLPDEGEPPAGRGANRDLSAARALALQGTPCAATQKGCTVGFGPPIAPLVGAAAQALQSAFAKKPDKRGRVAIPLDDPPTATGSEGAR